MSAGTGFTVFVVMMRMIVVMSAGTGFAVFVVMMRMIVVMSAGTGFTVFVLMVLHRISSRSGSNRNGDLPIDKLRKMRYGISVTERFVQYQYILQQTRWQQILFLKCSIPNNLTILYGVNDGQTAKKNQRSDLRCFL